MARGGYRPGAGRKPNPDKAKKPAAPVEVAKVPAEPRRDFDMQALAAMLPDIQAISEKYSRKRPREKAHSPFRPARHPAKVMPPKDQQMAFDSALIGEGGGIDYASGAWAEMGVEGFAEEGLVFLGYPYLSELAQRPEYRVISETIADDATRKWIDFDVAGDEEEKRRRRERDPVGEAEREADPDERRKRITEAGKLDKIKALKDDQERLEVRSKFYDIARLDGFFGRSHLYIDLGDSADDKNELLVPIGNGRDEMSKGKVPKNSLKQLKVIEPVWTYPLGYNATNPIRPFWYDPQTWFVMGTEIHCSRLMTFIGHPVPDLLKPAYSFGGLSLTQMAKPYVDIWLTTRQSVADIIHSFSVMVLMTDLQTILQPGNAGALMARVAMFNMLRDNQGVFAINKNTEDFKNVSASLSGLHELQAQAQEHMAAVSRIPLVKLTGIQPAGLNASSDGEIKVYDDTISAYQNRFFRPGLTRVVNFEQLSLFGEIDPQITFHFEPLREMTQAEKGQKEKDDADRDQKYVDMGAIAAGEVRKRVLDDPELPYAGLGLDPDDVPDLAAEEAEGLEPPGGRPQPGEGGDDPERDQDAGGQSGNDADPFGATDAEWREGDHPRAPDGKFGSGGGSSTTKTSESKKLSTGSAKATTESPKVSTESLKPSDLKKIGGQKGSNEGGVFEDKGGNRFYVKRPATKDHVANELAAARLYRLAGVNTLDYRPVEGGNHVATSWQNLDKGNVRDFTAAERKAAARDFAVHAWLGNWDAAGTGGDNQGIVDGKPTTLDVGGSLRYRAQGSPKGAAWGDKVSEIDTMRDPKMSPDAARLFGKMSDADLRASVERVTAIPDADIKAAVGGDNALAKTLIARKRDLARRFELQAADEAPFEESKHPRAPDGKFTSGTGGGSSVSTTPSAQNASITPEDNKTNYGGMYVMSHATPAENHAATVKKVLDGKAVAGHRYRKLVSLLMKDADKFGTKEALPQLKERLAEGWAETAKKLGAKGKTDDATAAYKKAQSLGWSGEPVALPKSPSASPEKSAATVAESTPTPAELAAAKKTAPLQMKFVPGDKPTTAKFQQGAETIIKAFNDKYAGKEITDPAALAQKIADFKGVSTGVNELAKIESGLIEAAKAQEAAKKTAAAKAKADAIEAEMNKPENKRHYDILKGIGADHSYIEHAKQIIQKNDLKITPLEGAHIRAYVGSHYGPVNAQLRRGVATLAQYRYAQALDAALDKMPVYKGKVTRGLKNLTADQWKRYSDNVGSVVPEPGFQSAGVQDKLWGSYTLIIESKTARDIRSFNPHEGGGEVVFKNNTAFLVKKVEGKTAWLEEV